MSDLNDGKGQCQSTARLLVKPVQAVIDLGAASDVLTKTLNAVHHANRHGSAGDFIAVALPSMTKGRNCMLPGHEIELIGSDASLNNLLQLEGMIALRRRGMLQEMEVGETFAEPGMIGAAYVRDRNCEKRTPGWIRRSRIRAEKRGKPLGKPVVPQRNDLSALALYYGQTVIHVRERVGEFTQAPLMVSTYGFSGAKDPAILPVMPESARGVGDAA